MKKILLLFKIFVLSAFAFGPLLVWAQPPQYHNGPLNTSSGNSIPLAFNASGVRGQLLYPVGVFGTPPGGHQITDLYWAAYTLSTGSSTYSQLHISMKQANISSLSTTAYETGMTIVFSSTSYTITYVGGNWFKITLQTPFVYDPTLPLIIEVNQLQNPFNNFFSALSTQGYPSGAWRNYSFSYNATIPVGGQQYMTALGFDLVPTMAVPNDAGVASVDSPSANCVGTYPATATIENFGTNQITTATVNWTFNGILRPPVTFNGLLDTANGLGSHTATVALGNVLLTPSTTNRIKAWTTNPNNITDTVNYNDTATATMAGYAYPNINFGPDDTLCPGTPYVLNVNGTFDSLRWSNNSTASTLPVTTSGTYWVKAYNKHCMDGDTITISYHPAPPVVNLGPDTSICFGNSITLNATAPGVTYLWNNNSTAATKLVSGAGLFWVTISDANGCIDRDTIAVGYIPEPNVSMTVSPGNVLCYGVPYTFTAIPFTTGSIIYQWKINGINSGSQTTANTFTPTVVTGDSVSVDLITDVCSTVPLVIPSNKIRMAIKPEPRLINGITQDTAIENTKKNYAVAPVAGHGYLWRASGGTVISDSTTFAVQVMWGPQNINGSVTLIDRDPSNCEYTNVLPVNVISIVGIEEESAFKLGDAYPNPANSFIIIPVYSKDGKNIRVELLDISGKTVSLTDQRITSGETLVNIEVSNLENGLYFYRVSDADGYSIVRKLEIIH